MSEDIAFPGTLTTSIIHVSDENENWRIARLRMMLVKKHIVPEGPPWHFEFVQNFKNQKIQQLQQNKKYVSTILAYFDWGCYPCVSQTMQFFSVMSSTKK